MGSAFGAGFGADMLQDILRRKFEEAVTTRRADQEQQRIRLDEQRMAQDAELRAAQLQSLEDARAATAAAQTTAKAARIATMLKPGAELDPSTVGALQAGDMGDLVEHKDATLDSRNLTGAAEAGKAPRILGLASSANPGQDERDVFTGTAAQQQAEDERRARADEQAAAREERARARREAQEGRAELVQLTAQLRPQGQTHPRFNVVQGTDANGKAALIRTNVDTGNVDVLPVPAGANFTQRERPVTIDQTNLSLYGKRIEQAESALKQLEAGVSKMNPLAYEAQTRLDHPAVQSKEMQAYQQAARNFIAAVLRRESGAAISASEFAEARKQYLPMPGDTPETLTMKAKNRQIVYEQFKQGAGAAWHDTTAPGAAGGGNRVYYDANGNPIKK